MRVYSYKYPKKQMKSQRSGLCFEGELPMADGWVIARSRSDHTKGDAGLDGTEDELAGSGVVLASD